ncbi:MAG: hypothetical protein N2Z79_02085, partial [Candidatus Omnitrophica bacterium]|nr:hypothetical protein [Candidatus Omnitrophota bacterium]
RRGGNSSNQQGEKAGPVDLSSDFPQASQILQALQGRYLPLEGGHKLTIEDIKLAIAHSRGHLRVIQRTYEELAKIDSKWSKTKNKFLVLFMPGLKEDSFATAILDLGLIIVGKEPFLQQASEDSKIRWLAIKIAHEGTHIVNYRDKSVNSYLEDEYLAYKATYEALRQFGKSEDQIKAQELVYRAFEELIANRNLVCKYLGISNEEFREVYYEDVKLKGRYIGITLTQRGRKTTLWIDPESKVITKEEPPQGTNRQGAGSSAATSFGGIDFRTLPIVTEPMVQPNKEIILPLQVSQVGISLDPEREWSEIERLLNAGIIPSLERIKECILAKSQNGNLEEE